MNASNQKTVIKIMRNVGAIVADDHFVYTSGKHGSVYVRKDRLYPHTRLISRIGKMIATEAQNKKIDVVVGPAVCGIVLSQWVAYHLSRLTKRDVLSVFTEKTDSVKMFDKPQTFKRGYSEFVKDKRVLVVEDLTTTGASVKKVVEEVKKAGGQMVGVFVLINRNPKEVNSSLMGSPLTSLAVFEADAFDAKTCPLCKKNIPINTEVGHGKEFISNYSNNQI